MTTTPSYEHVQRGIIQPIALAAAAICLVLMYVLRAHTPIVPVLGVAAGVFALLSFAFAQLAVRDEGDRLSVRFGPIPLFGTTIPYAEMTAVERDRSTFLAGWGIHWTPKGMLWNIGGFDCVRVLTRARSIRIGSDDGEALIAFLESRRSV